MTQSLTPEGTEAFATAGQRPFDTWSVLEVLLAGIIDFWKEGFCRLVELWQKKWGKYLQLLYESDCWRQFAIIPGYCTVSVRLHTEAKEEQFSFRHKWKIPFTLSQSPRLCLHIVQNPKVINSQWYKTERRSKSSHLKSWNQQMF